MLPNTASLTFQPLIVQKKAVLHKQSVVRFVIRNVEVGRLPNGTVYISRVQNVDQICHLSWIPMHWLNFILNFKGVIFCKIHYSHHYIIWKSIQTHFELFNLPSVLIIVLDEYSQFPLKQGSEITWADLANNKIFLSFGLTSLIHFLYCNIVKKLDCHHRDVIAFFVWTPRELINAAKLACAQKTLPTIISTINGFWAQYRLPQIC